ncbi:MAG: hypothetical protein ACK5HU_07045 [Flavobacteriales bacterium]
MFQEKVNKIIDEGYNLSVSEVFSKSFVLIKNNIGIGILFSLIFIALSSIFNIIGFNMVGLDVEEMITTYIDLIETKDIERLGSFMESYEEISNLLVVLTLVVSIILAPLYIGLINYIYKKSKGEASVANIIAPYTSSKIGGLLICFTAIFMFYQIGTYLFFLPGFYAYGILFLAPIIYWFNDVSFGEALTASVKIAHKNLIKLIIIAVLLMIVKNLGILVFGVGFFFTFPLCIIGHYVVYRQIFIVEENDSKIDKIGAL